MSEYTRTINIIPTSGPDIRLWEAKEAIKQAESAGAPADAVLYTRGSLIDPSVEALTIHWEAPPKSIRVQPSADRLTLAELEDLARQARNAGIVGTAHFIIEQGETEGGLIVNTIGFREE